MIIIVREGEATVGCFSFPFCSKLNWEGKFWVFGVSMELTDSVKKLLKETARRRFQAKVVMELGYAGQLLVQKELG